MIERLRRLVQTPSLSREEAAVADIVAAELESIGLTVHRRGNNLWTEIGDAPRPRLLLNSHLDTVPPGQGWSGDPWTLRRDGDRWIGLGANDAKGCVVAMMEAAIALHALASDRSDSGVAPVSNGRDSGVAPVSTGRDSGVAPVSDGRDSGVAPVSDGRDSVVAPVFNRCLPMGSTGPRQPLGGTLVLALTAEEEITGNGLGTILNEIGPIDAALVGEPTGLTPMIAQRGLLILRCEARGRSSHPANTPSDCDHNAIAIAARDVLAIQRYDWGPPHEWLGACHAHVTMIEGGVARNVVPDRCTFYVDVRTTPNQPHGATIERLRRDLASAVHVHSDRLVPIETAVDERIVRAVLAALPGVRPAGSPAMSDMVFLAGIPAVKIGPGDTRRSHTPDEYVTEAELAAGADAYRRIASEYFARAKSG